MDFDKYLMESYRIASKFGQKSEGFSMCCARTLSCDVKDFDRPVLVPMSCWRDSNGYLGYNPLISHFRDLGRWFEAINGLHMKLEMKKV